MKRPWLIVLCITTVITSGCFYSEMTIGQGPHTGITEEYTQWYILWGVVPLGKASSGIVLDNDIPDSRVYVGYSGLDVLFNIFLTPFTTVGRNTVIIEK